MSTLTLLAGGTGLIGREVAAQWVGPGNLLLLVRRALPPGAPASLVVDFAALPALPAAGAAICCLGTTIKVAGSQQAFRAVDFDAVLSFARAARAAGAQRFAVVSSLGASAGSSNFYSRVKGEMEDALAGVGFQILIVARPSLLIGDRRALGQPERPGERLTQALAAPLAALTPKAWRPIAGATVARALLRALAQRQPGLRVLDNRDLHQLGHP